MEVAQNDAAWKWMVVFAAFLVHVICDGITYAFGIMLSELKDEFQESTSLSSWTISILVGVTLGSGPICSALLDYYGCQKVVAVGSILAAAGAVMSVFATSIIFLIISVGFVMGFGFSMMFCPSIVIVNMYFTDLRSLAVGIVVCGAGVGTFIFAPLSAYLIEEYTWRGTFLIYAGIILNGVPMGLCFKYPSMYMMSECETDSGVDVPLQPMQPYVNGHVPISALQQRLDIPSEKTNERVWQSAQILSTRHASQALRNRVPSRQRCFSFMNELERTTGEVYVDAVDFTPNRAGYIHPLARRDIFYSGNIREMPGKPMVPRIKDVSIYESYRNGIDTMESVKPRVESLEYGLQGDESDIEDTSTFLTNCSNALKRLLDPSLLKDPVYLLIAFSNFLTNVGYDMPRMFLPDHAEMMGIDATKAGWLLSIWGITNTVGRVMMGIISDQKWAKNHRLAIYNIFLMCCGLTNFASIACNDYLSLAIYSGFFGFFLSTYISLTSVVLVDLLGIDRLTNAFGLLLFFQGVGAIIGPPIGGLLMDLTQDYTNSFIFAGVSLFISGLMLVPIPYLIKRRSQSNIPKLEKVVT